MYFRWHRGLDRDDAISVIANELETGNVKHQRCWSNQRALTN